VLILVGVVAFRWKTTPSNPSRVIRFEITPPPGTSFVPAANPGASAAPFPIISPDGTRLAFAAADSQRRDILWIRPIDSAVAQPRPGTDGVRGGEFWSPDSRSLAFFADGKLKRIDISGGPPQTLCTADGGGAWSADGTIIYTPSPGAGTGP